jgi:hypothetical protein
MELTQEQIEKSISAAFDSVNLVVALNLLPTLTEEEADRKERNVKHLEIMMAKEWFANGLTTQQAADINALLA